MASSQPTPPRKVTERRSRGRSWVTRNDITVTSGLVAAFTPCHTPANGSVGTRPPVCDVRTEPNSSAAGLIGESHEELLCDSPFFLSFRAPFEPEDALPS